MSNNNNYNSSCAFSEQLITYLYSEGGGQETIKFEAHLPDCPNCSAELEGFGFARSSILDWKAAEFSNLETPIFDISLIEAIKSNSTVTVSNQSREWFGGIKSIFSFNSQWAAAALAVLVVCGGAAWLALNFSGDRNNIAQNAENTNLIKASVSPTIAINPQPKEVKNAAEKAKKSAASIETTDLPKPIMREKQTITNKSIVKISSDAPKNNSETSVRNPKTANDNGKKSAPVQKQKVPNLNSLEDEEDETIRLADLFAELDTR
ncbi:MAG: hypothetical protein LH614_12775 [Pyrinomonadaceae bacterium]|nr:hypothetical protein [Pyrinomonadaceae bacterium]